MAQNMNNCITEDAEDLTLQPALRLIDASAPAAPDVRVLSRRDNLIELDFRYASGNSGGDQTQAVPAKRRVRYDKLFDLGVVLLLNLVRRGRDDHADDDGAYVIRTLPASPRGRRHFLIPLLS